MFLSTASSGLNSLAAVTLEDIVKKIHPNITEQKATMVSKLIGEFTGRLMSFFSFI